MAKAPSIEDKLAELATLGKEPDTPDARKQLHKHLAGKISLIVAKSAEIVANLEDHEFTPDLIAAFHRFMKDPAKTDKGCAAKIAIIKALLAADWSHAYTRAEAAYPLASLRHDKYWSPVGRVDNVWGDRNLSCSCPPLSAYDD